MAGASGTPLGSVATKEATRSCLGHQGKTANTPTPGVARGRGVSQAKNHHVTMLDRAARRDQYESELITSPPARVPSCHHVLIEIEPLMNWTCPSPIITLAPPEWLLLALTMLE